ncbi:MAG: hypothetical protein BAJALOKI1v1_650010 [Promethearchaeota archaeon]|nr:MAG: hypothetical protein BAJALOKI1v1_650010 [Candidatus Lokiarchaeota archaeon]
MITTRETINYQFSLIFGYQSPNENNISVGDIISPGMLSERLIKELSIDVIKYFSQYNAMLRDYTGSELFFVEFELNNISFKKSLTSIYPKSMILVPGNYKECESLMLALKPERGYLNIHKSNNAINNISELFFEVEEFANRPELNEKERELLFERFASRFSKKLYGSLIENKWNKKLVGISESLPTEKDYLNQYGKLQAEIDILWHKSPKEIQLNSLKFEDIKEPFEGKTALEHIKFNLPTPTSGFVAEKTLKLGSNLLNLANIGTIDTFQEKIINIIIDKINKEKLEPIEDAKSENWIVSTIDDFISEFNRKIKEYFDLFEKYLISGVKGTLDYILQEFNEYIKEHHKDPNNLIYELHEIADEFIKHIFLKKENVIANDLRSAYNYFSELINQDIQVLTSNLPKYLKTRHLKRKTRVLINNLKSQFAQEEQPVKDLAHNYIEKFHEFILKNIKDFPLLYSQGREFNEKHLSNEFFSSIKENLSDFIESIRINGKDIISITELEIDDGDNIISNYLHKLKRLPEEIHFLLSYILRYSTINRFLKDTNTNEISDPVSFSTKFHRFLEKRLSGISLICKSYILDWIMEYGKIFLNEKDEKKWTLNDIYIDFITYLEEKDEATKKANTFFDLIDTILSKEANENEKNRLLQFLDIYSYYKSITEEFPRYLKSQILNEISQLNHESEHTTPLRYISKNGEEDFFNYIRENELKYFSPLIPIPKTLILKTNLNNEEKQQFKGDLYQVLEFNLMGENKLILNVQDNFKEIFREWIKEL